MKTSALEMMAQARSLYAAATDLATDRETVSHGQRIGALIGALAVAIGESPDPSASLTSVIQSLLELAPILPSMREAVFVASTGGGTPS